MTQSASTEWERARLVHREIQQLSLLVAVAVLAFFATRTMAAHNRAMRRDDAAEWFARGEQAQQSGRLHEAVDMFRHAAVRDPQSTAYKLALARALDADHQEAAAAEALLALRDVEPENPDVNIALARLSLRTFGDTRETVRYYQSGLNALWRPSDRDRRRTLRLELIQFLMAQRQPLRAVPELLTLATNLPDEAAWKTRVASLLLEVDEPHRALALFQEALKLDPGDRDARAGADRARALVSVEDGAKQ